jgi:hypothetical protein
VDVPAVRAALAELDLDAWLLFEFRGQKTEPQRQLILLR